MPLPVAVKLSPLSVHSTTSKAKIERALAVAMHAARAEGAAVYAASGPLRKPRLLYALGDSVPGATVMAPPRTISAPVGRTATRGPVLTCRCRSEMGRRWTLVLQRAPSGPPWGPTDHVLAQAMADLLVMIPDDDPAAAGSGIDPLTGLIGSSAFTEQVVRRFARLDHEDGIGILLVADIDGFTHLAELTGSALRDEVVLRTARLLQATFRPHDLVGRIEADRFAVWLDDADHMIAAERAEQLRVGGRQTLSHLADILTRGRTLSVGIAPRSRVEPVDALFSRAVAAVRQVKRDGGGHWRVAHADPVPPR